MKKNLSIPVLVYEMLFELSNKQRKKPEKWLEEVVKEQYKKID